MIFFFIIDYLSYMKSSSDSTWIYEYMKCDGLKLINLIVILYLIFKQMSR